MTSGAGVSIPLDSSGAGIQPTEASPFPVGMEWREKELGLDSVFDLDRRTYAEYQRRVAGCMKKDGFDYAPVQFVDERRDYYRAINPLYEPTAAKYGYHPPPSASATDSNRHVTGFDGALDGTDVSPGCAPKAFKLVHDVVDPLFSSAQQLLNSLDSAIDGFFTSEVGRQRIDEWYKCMSATGYSEFDSPMTAQVHFLSHDSSSVEINLRLADLQCDRSVGLTTSRSEWEGARFETWRDSSAIALAELQDQVAKISEALTRLETQTV